MRRRIRPRHVEVLRLQPGDMLVYRHSGPLDEDIAEQINEQLQQFVPEGTKCLVLTDGRLQVVRGAEKATSG